MTVDVIVEPVAPDSGCAGRARRLVAALRGTGVRVAAAMPGEAPEARICVALTPAALSSGRPDTVAWIDTETVERTDTAWDAPPTVRWRTTCATAAAAVSHRWPAARPVIAEVPGHPGAKPVLSPDPAARSGVVVPADGLQPERLDLVLAAYAAVPGDEPLLLLGADVDAADERVVCHPEPTPVERADLIRNAVVVVLAARGLTAPTPAMEAFGLGTGVVVCRDGGAVLELVRDKVTGRVVAPEVAALTQVLHVQVGIPQEPVRHGARGRAFWESRSWSNCLRRLLGPAWRFAAADAGS